MKDGWLKRWASIVPPSLTLRSGAPLRGRVHRVSIVAGGEVSVVLRFGLEEPRARELDQGGLIDVYKTAPPAPKESNRE